jgi:hypothetical protein
MLFLSAWPTTVPSAAGYTRHLGGDRRDASPARPRIGTPRCVHVAAEALALVGALQGKAKRAMRSGKLWR